MYVDHSFPPLAKISSLPVLGPLNFAKVETMNKEGMKGFETCLSGLYWKGLSY